MLIGVDFAMNNNQEGLKLLIVDSDDQFSELAGHHLSSFPDVRLLGRERSGRAALRRIRADLPDAVLFDLILPELDGISLLRGVMDMPSPPAMICCTRFYSDVALEAARTYGASYLLYKPVELSALHPAITACTQMHRSVRRVNRASMEAGTGEALQFAHIRNHLVSLGIPSKLIGCGYLAEGVRMAAADVSLMRNLSKGLYLEIARSMNTTPSRVERCIRNAIYVAYQSGSFEGKLLTCPSNKEFINYVLRSMEPRSL